MVIKKKKNHWLFERVWLRFHVQRVLCTASRCCCFWQQVFILVLYKAPRVFCHPALRGFGTGLFCCVCVCMTLHVRSASLHQVLSCLEFISKIFRDRWMKKEVYYKISNLTVSRGKGLFLFRQNTLSNEAHSPLGEVWWRPADEAVLCCDGLWQTVIQSSSMKKKPKTFGIWRGFLLLRFQITERTESLSRSLKKRWIWVLLIFHFAFLLFLY